MVTNEQQKRDQLIARIKQVMGCNILFGSPDVFPVTLYRVPDSGIVDHTTYLVKANNYEQLENFYQNIRGIMKAPTP